LYAYRRRNNRQKRRTKYSLFSQSTITAYPHIETARYFYKNIVRRFGEGDKIIDIDEIRTDIDCLTVLYKILQPYVRTG